MNRFPRLSPALALCLLSFSAFIPPMCPGPASAAGTPAPASATLPDTPAGRGVADYFKAFNTQDSAVLGEFFRTHVAPAALAERPVAARLQFARRMWEDAGRLTPVEVSVQSPGSIGVRARTADGEWMQLDFEFETTPPYPMVSFRAQPAPPPGKPGRAPDGPPLTETQVLDSVSTLFDGLTRQDKFSGAVLVARDEAPVLARAYGLANREAGTPNGVNTKFNLGSINKLITKLAVCQLAEQGRLRLDDSLGKFFPDYPQPAARRATIQQLLEMKSGVVDFFGEEYRKADHSKLRNVSDFIPLFASKPLWFEPGQGQQYSNGGYVLLGAIIEQASGQNYYDYVREHIYRPAGMDSTDSFGLDEVVPNRATGYTTHDDSSGDDSNNSQSAQRRENFFSLPWRGSSAGGGYSTTSDLLKFVKALREGRLVGPLYAEYLFIDHLPPAGADGFKTRTIGSGMAGGSPGVNGLLILEGRYTAVILSNYDPPSAVAPGRIVGGWLRRAQEAGGGGGIKRVVR